MPPDETTPAILVVDDDSGLSFLIEQNLRREQWHIFTVNSGAAALEWLETNTPDLILLDLQLQDIGGGDLIARLSDAGRLIPFIIITGQGHEKVAVEMMKRGALDYVTKDVQFLEHISKVVRHALKQIEQQRRLVAAAASLRESEERFQLMADHAPVLVWLSGVDKSCTWLNRPWLVFTGRTMEQELGNGWSASIHPDDLARSLETYTTAFDARKPFAMEYRLRRHDGQWRWVYDQGTPLFDDSFRGYIGSCLDITDRKRMERQILEIAEREQVRIGQELHDGLGQQLTSIEFLCESLKGAIRRKNADFVPRIEQIGQYLRGAITETRLISHGLAPLKMTSDGLMDSLQQLAALVTRTGRLECTLECPAPVLIEDRAIACHFFRIAQEAANNAIKHAQAKNLVIRLTETPASIHLAISDDGAGFKPSSNGQKGIGLEVMRHRASVIGANLNVHSMGSGTTVSCELLKIRCSALHRLTGI
ncbi:MAG: response regulator [Limisphaerales bacterium]